MKAINYPEIVRQLREIHKDFFIKYRLYVEKNVSERLYERETAYARIKLIANALKESGVVDGLETVDIFGYSSSIALISAIGREPVFILNDCTEIIVVTGGVVSADAISGRLVLVSGEGESSRKTFFKRYHDVLSDEFDWVCFSREILEIIHKAIYGKEEAHRDLLSDGLGELFEDGK